MFRFTHVSSRSGAVLRYLFSDPQDLVGGSPRALRSLDASSGFGLLKLFKIGPEDLWHAQVAEQPIAQKGTLSKNEERNRGTENCVET